MFEFLDAHPQFAPIAIVFGVLLVLGLVGTLGAYWVKVRKAELRLRQFELEAALKQDMLQRGMSAEEIKQVLAASLGGTSVREESLSRER